MARHKQTSRENMPGQDALGHGGAPEYPDANTSVAGERAVVYCPSSEVGVAPQGYSYADDMTYAEIARVVFASGLYTTIQSPEVFINDGYGPDSRRTYLGVRCIAGNTLVAVAKLIERGDEAHLITLAVDPGHQHRGIARNLVKLRVQLAEQAGALSIHTLLKSTNTLPTLYEELGFQPNGCKLSDGDSTYTGYSRGSAPRVRQTCRYAL